jgi:hypothetical protein
MYSSADNAVDMLGTPDATTASDPGAAAIGAALERPRSASSAAEEDVHRRLAHLGTGFGAGFF